MLSGNKESSISPWQLATPVALFIFRRPETTKLVFDAIARAKPTRLFVIADGPRNADEAALCAETRAIVNRVGWDCEVITNYADANLGLKARISSGLDWVFDQVEEAIVLEDDCLPDDTFFRFCQELLELYRENSSIMHISGDCFVKRHRQGASYYFSRYAHVWGWATWRRAWKLYDGEMAEWNNSGYRKKFLDHFSAREERLFWEITLDQLVNGVINTWDYQWACACILHHGLAINPARNLVSNIGFGTEATNTTQSQSSLANLSTVPMSFPLKYPKKLERDVAADRETAQMFFTSGHREGGIVTKIAARIQQVFGYDDP